MNDRYKQAKEIFLRVCDLSSAERKAILDRECAGNAELRAEVESLIVHHHLADHDPAEAATSAPSSKSSAGHPMRIGPYRVHHEIGRGGMGVVYVAVRDDDQFKRRVALKVLKRGMDTDDVLRRFELERQLLAAMNHPNIARLYDGGQTDDGRPYFVMEYVEGLPLDEYCDVHRLHIDERLELFRTVCAAVHYAHQNLVVHRDLKPGNILVSKDGVPKLLDFGIAKLINPEFAFIHGDPTAPEFRVMTPEYASPEQVRGNPITTASDVYSLGVILYELVSGHRPYHIKSRVRAELERIICDEEPDRPSTAISKIEQVGDERPGKPASTRTVTPESVSRTRESGPNRLRRRIAGDIDNIVLMAMRKEPQRRYKSAEQLAEDLRRHLTGLTVIARKDTLGYRSLKFIKRNRGPVAVAAVIAGLLLASVIVTSALAQKARREAVAAQLARAESDAQRKIAQDERDNFQSLLKSNFKTLAEISGEFQTGMDRLVGAVTARQILGEIAVRYYDLVIQATGTIEGFEEIRARLFQNKGDLLGWKRNPNLNMPQKALECYEQVLAIRQSMAAQSRNDAPGQLAMASCLLRMGDVSQQLGHHTNALTHYERALVVLDPFVGARSADLQIHRLYTSVLLSRGDIFDVLGRDAERDADYDQTYQMRLEAGQNFPNDERVTRDLTVIAVRLATRAREAGQAQEALEYDKKMLDAREKHRAAAPTDDRAIRDLAEAHRWIALDYLDLGNTDEAISHCRSGLALVEGLLETVIAEDMGEARTPRAVADLCETLGLALRRSGQNEAAIQQHARVLSLIEPLAKNTNGEASDQRRVAYQQFFIGGIRSEEGKHEQARAHLQAAKIQFQRLATIGAGRAGDRKCLAEIESLLGTASSQSP
jgi:serine/threonine protein kinase/tetratricopeptide (TPR) repeat protein